MKILYAINSSKLGGAEIHTLALIRGMYARGHEVFVWCPSGELVSSFKEEGANVTQIKIGLDLDLGYIFKLSKFLKKNKIDIVHAHELKAVGNALIAAKWAKVPVKISHTHTPISEWQIPAWKKFLNIKTFYSPLVNIFATREIALTPSRKHVKVDEGIKEYKLEIIPNGVKLSDFDLDGAEITKYRREIRERYGIDQNDFIFGNISRLTVEKGTDILIDAFYEFLQHAQVDASKTKLLIAGGGVLEESLKEKVLFLGIEDNVIFAGKFKEEDKLKFYATFDFFVFPSLAEGFGLVLIEAMAMGLPTIASDLEVLQEVGGSTVIFFGTGDAQDLTQKMYHLHSKRDRLFNVSEAAKQRVEELYSMQKFIDNYENLYLELLEDLD